MLLLKRCRHGCLSGRVNTKGLVRAQKRALEPPDEPAKDLHVTHLAGCPALAERSAIHGLAVDFVLGQASALKVCPKDLDKMSRLGISRESSIILEISRIANDKNVFLAVCPKK